MGITVRREPIVSDIPKAPEYKYLNITDFKGINKTDNPFTAKVNTASEMLNLYVDESNALTTRPRLEWFMKLNLSITTGKIISVNRIDDKYLVQYTQASTDTEAKLAWITDAGVKTDITRHTNAHISTTNKIQAVKGPDYYALVDGKGYKVIRGNTVYPAGAYAYAPITKVGKIIGDSSSGQDFESPNLLDDSYREEYIVGPLQDSKDLTFEEFSGYKVIMKGKNGKETHTWTNARPLDLKYHLFTNNEFNDQITGLSASKDFKVIVACFDRAQVSYGYVKQIAISRDYGSTFSTVVFTNPVYAVAVGGSDGSIIFALHKGDQNATLYSISTDSGETFTLVGNADASYDPIQKTPKVLMSDDGTKIVVATYNSSVWHFRSCTISGGVSTWVTHTTYDAYGNSTSSSTLDYCDIIFANNNQTTFYSLLTNSNNNVASALNLRLIGSTSYDSSSAQYYLGVADYPSVTGISTPLNIRRILRCSEDKLYLFYYDGTVTGSKSTDNPLKFVWNTTKLDYVITHKDDAVFYANNIIAVLSPNRGELNAVTYFDETLRTIASSSAPSVNIYLESSLLFNEDASNVLGYSGYKLFSNYAYYSEAFLTVYRRAGVDTSITNIRNKLNDCLFMQSFHNYLWLGGSGNLVVRTGVSADTGLNNLLYLPKVGYKLLGDDTNIVTGFNISNDITMIAYLKDNLWTISYGELSEGIYDFIYTEVRSNQGHIAVGETITTPLQEIPLQLNTTGVFGYQQITNVITSDKTSVLLTEPINELLLKEIELTKAFFINHLYWTLMFVPNGENTHVYVYDDRYNAWYYWEIYTRLVSVVTIDDSVVIIDSAGLFYKLTSEDALDEFVPDKTVYYDWYGNDANQNKIKKIIPWLWKSQIMPLGTINYAKRLVTTTFIMTDTDAVDEYSLNYKFNVYRKLVSQSNLTTISNRLNYIQSMTKKTMIPRFNYLQLELSNVDDETDMDNNKLRLVGLAFKYVLLEVLI